MNKNDPFEDMPKSKLIKEKWYRLHNQCFHKKDVAQKEASEFRNDGFFARIYKKSKYYFIYIRRK